MGGYWARFVRTTKESLRNVLGQALLGDEQLRTVLCVVDACLNARPLTLVEEATDKLVPLSPFQLLTGRISQSELALPRAQARQLNSRWRYRQQLIAKWWRRWRNGYSPLGYRAGIGQTAATAWPERHGSRPQLLRSPGPLAIWWWWRHHASVMALRVSHQGGESEQQQCRYCRRRYRTCVSGLNTVTYGQE
ncbi:hypothetical protein T02_3233 [Trichinella nativa]|uniref:DUF5641 domain-containing protein n=1 Tax=Trichinella nativa TaxID=6335 RepID=A0A0V1KPC1_9BILA|nr:hypothetical protein T02_3233 [Trichinella nativa]